MFKHRRNIKCNIGTLDNTGNSYYSLNRYLIRSFFCFYYKDPKFIELDLRSFYLDILTCRTYFKFDKIINMP